MSFRDWWAVWWTICQQDDSCGGPAGLWKVNPVPVVEQLVRGLEKAQDDSRIRRVSTRQRFLLVDPWRRVHPCHWHSASAGHHARGSIRETCDTDPKLIWSTPLLHKTGGNHLGPTFQEGQKNWFIPNPYAAESWYSHLSKLIDINQLHKFMQ